MRKPRVWDLLTIAELRWHSQQDAADRFKGKPAFRAPPRHRYLQGGGAVVSTDTSTEGGSGFHPSRRPLGKPPGGMSWGYLPQSTQSVIRACFLFKHLMLKHELNTKWKSICHLRLPYSSSADNCWSSSHFLSSFLRVCFPKHTRPKLNTIRTEWVFRRDSSSGWAPSEAGGLISVRDGGDPPHSCFNTKVL